MKDAKVDTTTTSTSVQIDTTQVEKRKSSLAERIYFFAPEFNKSNCTAIGSCDCCASNAIFLTDSTLLWVDYCMGDETFVTAKYTLDEQSLTLETHRTAVKKEYNWAIDADTTGTVTTQYFYKIENIKPTTLKYKRVDCRGTMVFKRKDQHGAIDNERQFAPFIDSLKHEGIWTKLQLE